jgi:hypothetical protein
MSSNIVFYSFTQLYNFLGETHALNDILTCCYGLVSNSSDISSEAREEFVKYIKYWSNNSSFFGNKTDTVEIKKQQSELLKENCPTKVST